MTELYCSLRSLQIVLEPDGVVLARNEKRVRSLLLHPSARDLSCIARSARCRSCSNPMVSSSLADEKRVRSLLLLHPAARDLS